MLYILIIVVLTVLDQLSKNKIVMLSGGQIGYSIPVIKDFFDITYVENHGGIFGLFQGKIDVFTIFSIALIAYIIKAEYQNWKSYTKLTKIGISIVAAGALGNMIDRIVRGFVVDMIDFYGIWNFIFNVADMYIHIGIYIIIIDYFIKKYKNKK